jgi:ferredoxin-thioredoxin reductase catalytic subunit
MTAAELYEVLKKAQEPKGYYFNVDRQRVDDLLEALLTNKQRYGYMCCPCRLAANDRAKDKDIICPCVYREPDVKEYGSCYCNLYVSQEWNEGKLPRDYVPERRPAEKMTF